MVEPEVEKAPHVVGDTYSTKGADTEDGLSIDGTDEGCQSQVRPLPCSQGRLWPVPTVGHPAPAHKLLRPVTRAGARSVCYVGSGSVMAAPDEKAGQCVQGVHPGAPPVMLRVRRTVSHRLLLHRFVHVGLPLRMLSDRRLLRAHLNPHGIL